ncbi:hypothetical protein GCM10028805_16250 [Spirosoma harenae]
MKSNKNTNGKYRLARLSDANEDLTKQWVVVYYLWSEEHQKLKRCRVIVKGNTGEERKKDAAKVIREINQELRQGAIYQKRSAISQPIVLKEPDKSEIEKRSYLLDAIEYFLTVKKRSLKSNSHKTYRSSIKLFVQYLQEQGLGRIRLNQFTISQANGFMDYILTDVQLSNKSHNKHLGTYETLFNFYIQRGLLKSNPFGQIKTLPERAKKHKAFSLEQVARFKQVCELSQDAQLWLFVNFIYYTFVRPQSELRLLKIGDILGRTIRISAENAKNNRTAHVLIPPPLEKLIQQHRLRDYPSTHYVFSSGGVPGEKPVYEKYFYNQHRRALIMLKMDHQDYDLYGWKHTGVVSMYRATKDVKLIQQQCRHGSLDQTDKYLRDLGLFLHENQFDGLEGI